MDDARNRRLNLAPWLAGTERNTVVALKTAKYAQPGGGSREVPRARGSGGRSEDEEGGQPRVHDWSRRSTITDKKKITRAGKAVTTADVTARKDERVAVVVDHDTPGDEAIHVRFQAQ